jgi:hypothetical protein
MPGQGQLVLLDCVQALPQLLGVSFLFHGLLHLPQQATHFLAVAHESGVHHEPLPRLGLVLDGVLDDDRHGRSLAADLARAKGGAG